MLTVQDGQCGVCKHFGEGSSEPQLVQIRTEKSAPVDFATSCGNPSLSAFNLNVTAVSTCGGFEKAN